ncbi:MAG TPA: ABC transporter permease subunit [Chloroflexota bacterium]|nr:ABC transporter permease subunit [Chloroflexota bacterium]HUM68224.1 ABC transporter permease subunit [Chloroflexota bacterium]
MTTQTKSTVNQDLILAARQGLIPVRERPRLGGFGNMLRKELGHWWNTSIWWVQTLIWVFILNGITTIVARTESMAPAELLQEVVSTFLAMSVGAIGMGVVITVQGAIVGEKQSGTAAWVMSKPASRASFILAKWVAYAVGFAVTAVLIPSTIFVITMRALIPAPLPLLSFLSGLVLVILGVTFYLALTLMLGTFANGRGPIAGIGIGFIMAGLLLKGFIPFPVLIITPWPLGDIAGALALGNPLPAIWPVPVVATTVWIVVLTAVALWRFGREEF